MQNILLKILAFNSHCRPQTMTDITRKETEESTSTYSLQEFYVQYLV